MGNNDSASMKAGGMMRAVPTNYIKGEVTLAENLYNKEGAVLLRNGAKLSEKQIKQINQAGIFTVYISDQYSPDMDLDRIVDINMRIRGVNLIREIYEKVGQGKNISKDFDRLGDLFEDVYDEILLAKNRQINYIDIKSVDNYTYGHALNVAILAILLGMECDVKMPQLKTLFIGAALMDIGMMIIPKEQYQRDVPLTDIQIKMVQQHVTLGYEYLKHISEADAFIKNSSLTHHERHDGSGYPRGLKGTAIHLFSRIISLCDVYDAMTSDRIYRGAVPPNEALEYLMGNAGQLFDFEITEKFCKKINPYPVGSLVKLNTGDIAVVKEAVPDMPLRPVISIINNVGPKLVMKDVDLIEKRNLVIIGPYY